MKIKGKHKKEKKEEKHRSKLWFKFLIAIVIAFVIIMAGYLIVEKVVNKPNVDDKEINQSYQIESVGNISFENAKINIDNGISHISIDLVNGENKKLLSQEIEIKVKKDEKNISYKYVIPDIEQGQSYNIKLQTTGDLTNAQEIKVEGIEI